jgi:hypothetical protein
LNQIQERVLRAACGGPLAITVTESAREYLLEQGTDARYGARCLKRALERLLVHPFSNLIATRQVARGDVVRVDFDRKADRLLFYRERARRSPAPARRPESRTRPIRMSARCSNSERATVVSSLEERPRKR